MWTNNPPYVNFPQGGIAGVFDGTVQPGKKGRRIRDVIDGTSNSIMFVESAARPQVWQKRKLVPDSGLITSTSSRYVAVSSWAAGNIFAVRGYRQDPSVANEYDRWKAPGPCMVNCTNYYAMYSFHSGGVQMGLVDGSVHFLSENVDTNVAVKLLTINGGEVVGEF
jgi:hypothetical protein